MSTHIFSPLIHVHHTTIGYMKKTNTLRLFFGLLICSLYLSTALPARAQGVDGEWLPLKSLVYTAQTIYGERISIDSLVRAGKRVVIDFSGTYCGPCWQIHKRGTAERLWQKYGPEGTDELYFIWVEATGAKREEIEGKGNNTQGDWTNGGTIPYPIVSDAYMANALGVTITGIPKVVLLSAAGTYTEVQDILLISEEGVYDKSKECLSSQDAPVVRDLYTPSWGVTTDTPSEIQAYVGSVPPVTEYRWQVNGTDYATTHEPRLALTWPTTGEVELSLIAVNRNGASTPLSQRVQVRAAHQGATQLPLQESFEADGLLGWSRADLDGDHVGWTSLAAELKRLNVSADQLSAKTMSRSGEDCLLSWSFYPTIFRGYTDLVGYPVQSNNWLISPVIKVPEAETADTKLTLYARSFSKQFKRQDTLTILSVVAPIDPTVWESGSKLLLTTPVSYNWQKIEYDLSSLRGQEIQLILAHQTAGATGLLIDDLTIETTGHNATDSPTTNDCRVTILDGVPYVESATPIEWRLYTPSGALQAEGLTPEGRHQLVTEAVSQGLYILSITTSAGDSRRYKLVLP